MHKNIEKELKILLSEQQFYHILQNYDNLIFKKQVNTYYDNDKKQIKEKHGAMRIRQTDKFLFTLKMHSESGLLEYETVVTENSPTVFDKEDINELLTSYDISGPFYQTAELTTLRAVFETTDAELCFDINEYNGKKDYELEYEYKTDHDGIAVFQTILSSVHLQYTKNCDSKIKRALDSI